MDSAANQENAKSTKRFRNPKSHMRYINKSNREKGLEYRNEKGRIIPKKCFKKIVCKCRIRCHLVIDENAQKQIFEQFWSENSSWSSKSSFLSEHIKISECTHRRKPTSRKNIQFKKNSTRSYFLSEDPKQKICKSFFKKVLQISEGRIEHLLKRRNEGSILVATDQRGKHCSHRKTPLDKINDAMNFIRSLPTYESHYARSISSVEKKYLDPSLNLTKLYDDYRKQNQSTAVSKYMFRDIFYRRFNLKFKQPSQDTCDLCNSIKIKLQSRATNPALKVKLLEQRNNHHVRVENVSREYKEYVEDSILSGGAKVVLVYDLQKVLPTPKLNTNSAYYKRKLSTYNLCIHDATNNRSYMYIWHEGIASRGSQDVTSCLLYHFDHYISEECNEIVLFSDSCGGQNRNINTAIMLSHFLAKNNKIFSITQHFYLRGHSYNICDRRFAIIEKKQKSESNIYTPSQWKDLIARAKTTLPQFIVIEMNSQMFFSCQDLLAMVTKRKKATNGEPFSWLNTRKIIYKKSHPFHLFTETYEDLDRKYNENTEHQMDFTKIVRIDKHGIAVDSFETVELPLLWPTGRAISTEKRNDLFDLLDFIPPIHRRFYMELKYDNAPDIDDATVSDHNSNDED